MNTLDRINKHIRKDESGCWIWIGAKSKPGYGIMRMGRNTLRHAHRVSYEYFNYCTLTEDVCVCHRCDVKLCVNPEHLFLGTQADNIRDKTEKNRQAKGEQIGISQLTESVVIQIKSAAGGNIRQIARDLNLPYHQVWSVRSGRTWKHVELSEEHA